MKEQINLAGISVLIPVYNFEASPLVWSLHQQLSLQSLPFEIRCYDDGSTAVFQSKNRVITTIPRVVYREMPHNVGRSHIRNLLANDAIYDKLLFLDCDSALPDRNFINNYLSLASNYQVLIGGTIYATELPSPSLSLRWKYGKAREEVAAAVRNKTPYNNLTLNNMLIDRQLYLANPLDENITSYGHEDTKFGYALMERQVQVFHIDNPVVHIGLEENKIFLEKTVSAVRNFYQISHKQGLGHETKLYKAYSIGRLFPFNILFRFFYTLFKRRILKSLLSDNPSILYFDLFKLNLMLKEGRRLKREAKKNHKK